MKILKVLSVFFIYANLHAADVSIDDLLNKANQIYSAEKTSYINQINNILKTNGMPDLYANQVIKDVVADIDNNVFSTQRIISSIENNTKSISQVMANANFSNIPGLQDAGSLAIEKMKSNQSYESLVNQISTNLNKRFCSGELSDICDTKQINESLDSFKNMLPKQEFEIGQFSNNGKNNAKVQVTGQCACNPVMQSAYQGMTDYIVGENLSLLPSKIDAIIDEIKLRTEKLENENKTLDSLIANTKTFNFNLQKLKFELVKENELNYQK